MSSVYRKPTLTRQYLNFNSHHPYTVKIGIVRCLQHLAKIISSDTDAYQEEMISLRHNYPECITSAPRNLDWRIEDNTRKLTTVCLPYVKKSAKGSKRYVVHMTSGQYSQVVQLSGDISSGSSHQRNSTWSRTVLTPSLEVVVKYTKARQVTPWRVEQVEAGRIRRLKESAHMLGYNDLLGRPSREMSTIWELIIKKVRWKKIWIWPQVKIILIVVILLK